MDSSHMGHMSLDNGHHDSTKSPEWHSADSEAAMDAADRTERRRLQNRQAQRNHRKRVRAYISSLEQQVVDSILRDLPATSSVPVSAATTVPTTVVPTRTAATAIETGGILRDGHLPAMPEPSGIPTPPDTCNMAMAPEAPLESSSSSTTLSPTLSATAITTPPTPMTASMHSAFSPPMEYFPSAPQSAPSVACSTDWSSPVPVPASAAAAATRGGGCASCTSCLDVQHHRPADSGSMQHQQQHQPHQQSGCCCDCGAAAMNSRSHIPHYAPPWHDGGSVMYSGAGSDSGMNLVGGGQFTPPQPPRHPSSTHRLHHSTSRGKMNGGMHQHFNGAQPIPMPMPASGFGCSHTYRPQPSQPHGYGAAGSPRYDQVPLMRSPTMPGAASQSPPAGYGMQQIVNPESPAYQQFALVPVSELMYLHSNRGSMGHHQPGMPYQMPRYGYQP